MDKVYDKCCGIDVHKKLIVACFRKGSKQELRNFGATTRELLELANWLQNGGCEMVAMESTASYWKPLYNILESSELKAMVVNASHMKAVPGRKTDTKDAEWIAEHGDPDEYEKKMKQLEKEAALRAAQEAEAAEAAPEFAEMPERPFVDAEGEIEEAVDADFEVEK